MAQEIEFRKKLSEKEILKLKESEIQKIERVNEATAKLENAEGYKESQQKMRILFERTAPDMLPFVIYCLTFAPIATYSLYRIMELKDTPQFYWGLAGLLIIMILPLFILPKLPFAKWLRKKEYNNNGEK
jgi:predicted cobalt transporter CbtA